MIVRYVLLFFLSLIVFCASGQDTTRLSLLFIGDIMQHDIQIKMAYDTSLKRYDYSTTFQYVAPAIQSADVAIGNLELTLAGPPFKGYPRFCAPDELTVALKRAGMDVLVTANNHSADRGSAGIVRTVQVLDSLEILRTGTFKDEEDRKSHNPLWIERNGFRIALLNYTFSTNGLPVKAPTIVNMIDTAVIRQDINLAKEKKPDAIIVFMHWGAEYVNQPNSSQKRIADFCFKHGAKLVIGSHPHTLQPMEWRKDQDQFVAYSLGNFISNLTPRFKDNGGMVWIDLDKIQYNEGSTTSIQDAGYELNWVFKTSGTKPKFYAIPAAAYEYDTILITSPQVIELGKFCSEARMLLTKYNKDVEEMSTSVVDSYYEIFIDAEMNVEIPHERMKFFGIRTEIDISGKKKYFVGKFYDKEIAQQVLEELKTQHQIEQAFVLQRFMTRRSKLPLSKN